uniref:Uncharacterized protein n=2 Tax=Opuntia streptacantha TaxID=393608 RepID=A0A7C9AXW0_OPUST
MWPSPARPTYGLPPEMGMFVVAPATSFHHPQSQQHESLIPDSQSHHPSVVGNATNAAATIGVIPLLAAAPCFNLSGEIDGHDLSNRNRTGALHLWQNQNQNQQQQQQQGVNYPRKTINFESAGPNSLSSASVAVSGGGATTCQECGNQAKKDCTHRRCRTCCRSRGFECETHVKSTWVPAARRRERQIMGGSGGGASSGSTSGAKKPRLISSATTSHTSTSNTVDTGSSHQEPGSLPGQVKAPAVFKCVRVTAVEGGKDEYAYQAVVRIGGHVFKGFLYDQGVDPREGFPNMSELHLGGGSGSGGGGGGGTGRNGVSLSSPMLDPALVYGGGGAFLGSSTPYGNTIN